MIEIPLGVRPISDYSEYAGEEQVERIKERAGRLAGLRVLHLSGTPFGGGIVELLMSLLPLFNHLGLDVHWQALERDDHFFAIARMLHNSLQGMGAQWTREMADAYIDRSWDYIEDFKDDYDIVVVHDPQPAVIAGLLEERSRRHGSWVWRCHLDLSCPEPGALEMLISLLNYCYEHAVFTSRDFVPADLTIGPYVMAPSIDPLNPRNMYLEEDVVRSAVSSYGIRPDLPLVVQVSSFEPWKDPLGVIDAVELAREEVPDLQLALIGSMMNDDPEGYYHFRKTAHAAEKLPGVRLIANAEGIGNLGVNAFQRTADVVVQKSLREGFGLSVTEALWKSRAVVAGAVGGIPLQIDDGVNGFLVDSVEECAARIVQLLADRGIRTAMGGSGRKKVRERFLTPRHVEDYLVLFERIVNREGQGPVVEAEACR